MHPWVTESLESWSLLWAGEEPGSPGLLQPGLLLCTRQAMEQACASLHCASPLLKLPEDLFPGDPV